MQIQIHTDCISCVNVNNSMDYTCTTETKEANQIQLKQNILFLLKQLYCRKSCIGL